MTASLLVEIQTEELPPKALKTLCRAFAAGIESGLRARGFVSDRSVMTVYGTPRRLAVYLTHVAKRTADTSFRQKLLPVSIGLDDKGRATPALQKKLAALGVEAEVKKLQRESDGKQEVLIYEGHKPGELLIAALQPVVEATIAALPIPKMMSYQLFNGETTRFIRPAHHLIAMHGHAVVPVHAVGLQSGTKTQGHRFLAPGTLAVLAPELYAEQLLDEGYVIASFEERRAKIESLLLAAAGKHDAQPVVPADLLDEVTALVEWPVVYDSTFDAEYLAVPPECLLLTMQQNQKYFALNDAAGKLMNRFLLVANIEATDGGDAIRAGNARVVRARLADAKFFFDQDRRQLLESRVDGLADVVYHGKLGSQLQRVERIVAIAVGIAKELRVDAVGVERAARLAKADLRTLMVGEFPELQGVMGEYYAQHDGEATEVSAAIREHYYPRFAGDTLPKSAIGLCVALADKLETLVGLFGVGEKPTGERDPFALRRQALGILRMLMEKQLAIPFDRLLRIGEQAFGDVGAFKSADKEVLEFIYERLRGLLREQGYSAQQVEAVIASQPARIDQVPQQLAAVRAFMTLPEAESLAAANKRIGNILKRADDVPIVFDRALLLEPAERSLGEAFSAVRPWAEQLYASGDYSAMLKSLAPLKQPVDRFFDEVMVNVDDVKLRANRLGLLAALRTTMNRVADISKLSK
ncbi:MAG TPA: glycine--tRNA ligase subunit beta [Burkholderiaceae bacterium]|nr:glycine--tRNA ligase subunit beta [Burkholderiaceae bacterium]